MRRLIRSIREFISLIADIIYLICSQLRGDDEKEP